MAYVFVNEQEQPAVEPIKQRFVFVDEPTKPVVEPPKAEKLPFEARHPTLYGIGRGAIAETGKTLIPYLKYVDPAERERFVELSKQKQVRELLIQNLEAVALLAVDPLVKSVKPVISKAMKKWLPKTYKTLTKPIGKGVVKAVPEPSVEPFKPKLTPKVKPIGEAGETKIVPIIKDGIIDKKATEATLPTIQKGMVRLYRAESPTVKFEDVFDVEKLTQYKPPKGKVGKFYTSDLNHADYFRATYGKDAVISYVDVSESMAKASIFGEAGGGEYFIEQAVAKGAETAITRTVAPVKPKPVEAPVVPEPELPKYAGSVNLERQRISDAAKQLEVDMFAEAGVKTTVPREKTIAAAETIVERFKSDPVFYEKRIAEIKAGKTPTIDEEVAHRIINAGKFDDFVVAAKGVAEGTVDKTVLDTMQTELADQFFKVANPLAEQAGRRLSSYNIEVGKNRAFKAVGKLEKKLNDRQMKELGDVDFTDPLSVDQFVKRLPDPKLKEYVYEYWYNSILSGIPTHVVNISSNTAWSAFQIPHRVLTAGVDKMVSALTGKARTRYLNEVIPMMAGMKTGVKRGAKGAADMVRYGKVTELETKWAQEMRGALGAFDRSPNKTVREVGKYLTVPTKALRAMDVWANSIAYDSQINSLARRASNAKKLSGQARKSFEEAFVKNPPKESHANAIEYAKYSTFMDDPGWFSKGVIELRDKIPGGRLVVPFVNTIGNLLKRGVEMTPGIGLTLAKGKNPSEVIAKQIEGAIIAYSVLLKADKGEVTGAAPTRPTERDAFYRQGKKAWSMKVGNAWVQYRRIEPYNTIIASAAIAHGRIKNAKDDDEAIEIFANMANDFKNNLIDSSYLQGVTQILNRHGKIKEMPQRTASSFVPYSGFFRSINRAYEVATEGSAKLRDTSGWTGAFSTVIPGLSGKVPAKINVWGEEIELEGGVFRQWIPYKWATETTDPVEKAFEKLDLYPGLPSQRITIKGEKVKLDDDVYRNYVILVGHRAKKEFDSIIKRPDWQRALKDERRYPDLENRLDNKFKKIRNKYRKQAIIKQLGKKPQVVSSRFVFVNE